MEGPQGVQIVRARASASGENGREAMGRFCSGGGDWGDYGLGGAVPVPSQWLPHSLLTPCKATVKCEGSLAPDRILPLP